MATGQLGKNSRISYESKNKRTGLVNISVIIQRPDSVDLGPFPLVEYKAGYYKYDFVTTLSDLEGDYLGIISSPSEGDHCAHFKLSLFKPGLSGISNVQITDCEPLIGIIQKTKLVGISKAVEPLLGNIANLAIAGKLVDIENLKGNVQPVKLKGLTNKECP